MPRGFRRDALREATRDVHEQLDQLVGEWPDVAAYRAYLEATIRFRGGLEQGLARAPWPADRAWRPTTIAADLAADAADLQLDLPAKTWVVPPLDSSALLGLLYVSEGSALGAKFLRERAARLGFDQDFGARHLATMTTGSTWRGFLADLEALPDFDLPKAVASANATFAAALACYRSDVRAAA